MGCDIHLYVEKRVNPSHDWVTADSWEREDDRFRVPYQKSYYHDRCYSLFSMLANVRNGYGFAGCKTGEGFVPIAEQRGLPPDVTGNVRAEHDSWGGDAHSASFLTLEELLAYDWTQTTMLQGVLHGKDYREWIRWARENGQSPRSWAGMISGGGIKNISNAAMDLLIKSLEKEAESLPSHQAKERLIDDGLKDFVTTCEWQQQYYQCASGFLSSCMPRLWKLGKPENVRIVFWFDN